MLRFIGALDQDDEDELGQPESEPPTFDAIILRNLEAVHSIGIAIPLGYVKNLILHESNFDPRAESRRGRNGPVIARGLMQVTRTALDTWNTTERTRTDPAPAPQYTFEDMYDPEKNIRVGMFILAMCAINLRTSGLLPNFESRDYVAALTHAYNAGSAYSTGVARVVRSLVGRREAVTLDSITDEADALRARGFVVGQYVGLPERTAWADHVARVYLGEISGPHARPPAPRPAARGGAHRTRDRAHRTRDRAPPAAAPSFALPLLVLGGGLLLVWGLSARRGRAA